MRSKLFAPGAGPHLVGVVHLAATPGSPAYGGDFTEVLDWALRDARALAEGGLRSAIVENFGDVPFFPDSVPPETIASMAIILDALARATPELELGVNVLRNDARAALGLSAVSGASFLRVNVHVGAAVTDQGIVEGRAAETLRERARLAPGAFLLADVHVKHATPMGSETLGEAARETVGRGLADGLVVSGRATGHGPQAEDLAEVRSACPDSPLLVGSGFCLATAPALLAHADGAIVGTALKHDGDVHAPVDPRRVRELFECVRELGKGSSAAP